MVKILFHNVAVSEGMKIKFSRNVDKLFLQFMFVSEINYRWLSQSYFRNLSILVILSLNLHRARKRPVFVFVQLSAHSKSISTLLHNIVRILFESMVLKKMK